ncbi:MAG: leucine-rich repeat domain-containing protein, partial [Paludibacteraceae bacterium]|nr:leucine-rich repeat domain-containing protein [Paludibacteraceae bacterium]
SIGDYAFDNCTGLTFVTIPNSVTSIGNYAFYGCSSLTSVTIPNSVTSIGDFAFYRCSGLTSVTILNSVTSIGNYAFYGCSGLTALTIGEGVTSIGDWAFHNCSGLTSVTIPNSVTSIGYHAFDGCSSLTALTIGEGITSIGDWAFYNCTGLTTITCKAVNPPALGENVFYSTTIPLYVPASSVNTYKSTAPWSYFGNNILPIGGYITSGICGKDGEGNLADNLTWTFDPETGTLTIEGSGEMMDFDYNGIPWLDFAMQITNVTLPDGLTSIGARAFYDCSSLASINIPESVTEIKMLAFFYCSSLTSIVIPEGTKSLFETFKGCESLSSVVIPASVTSLTFYTFGGCVSLKEITNYATTPQSVEEDVFDQVDKANCKLYVPSSAVEAYKATEVWKDFDIQAAQGIEDIVVPTGEAQKILMNGTLLIERNGKTYNAQGAEVR